ncbi:16S rRNA (adenine(1518)-N(6)/adenine(1519)-N(6))-dimethyltransferase, partial [Streptomyces sp. NPDC048845]
MPHLSPGHGRVPGTRELAAALGVRPTKQRGQNFVIDANTVRRIVRT